MTVIVLFGGRSDERHVSVASAQNVVRALGSPLAWFWAPSGAIHDVALDDLLAHERAFVTDFEPKRPAIWPTLEQALDTIPVEDPVFLLALHGGEGEDGTVQRLLEQRGLPFTGSGSEASAAAFDKGKAKDIVHGRVTTAESRVVYDSNPAKIRFTIDDMLERYPRVVLKPLAAGSSRGLFFLDRDGDVPDVVNKVAALRIPYIIEQFITGRELTCGVADLGDGPKPLPVVEIEVDAGFNFDYEGKYLGKGTREICPANIPDDMARAAQLSALNAHVALGCEGYSRSDFVAPEDGMYFLELNTLPGLTTSSLVPQELKAANIDFRDFLERQIARARERAGKATRTPAAAR
jgi:D-alanine-D-alanine ligase